MPFHFKKKESATQAVRRLCGERIDDALECLRRRNHLEGIHEVRKGIKKLRAILQLVRGEIGKNSYRELAKELRSAANRLTAMRDAHMRLNAFGELTKHFNRKLPARPFQEIKEALRKNCRAKEREFLKTGSIRAVSRVLLRLKKHVDGLKIKSDGWTAIGPGFKKSCRKGRETLKIVLNEPSPENFHEWRKRVKDLWYHLRLLCPVWPKKLRAAADELETLSEYIGDDHDLMMLNEFAAEKCRRSKGVDELNKLIGSRQKELRLAALKLGKRFYSEKAERFCGRLERHWKIWRAEK